jgi:hypothetical protein
LLIEATQREGDGQNVFKGLGRLDIILRKNGMEGG